MFFCAANCCALKDINAVPFSFYLTSMPSGGFSLVKTAKRRFFATLRAVMMKKETVEKFFAALVTSQNSL
jgi:hypothetical protein